MSINDPQWGNSHRPEPQEPEQVPESAGTEPVQPDAGQPETAQPQNSAPLNDEARTRVQSPTSPTSPPQSSSPTPPPEGPPDLEVLWQQLVYKIRLAFARLLRRELPPPPVVTEPLPVVVPEAATDMPNWQALSFKSWLLGVSLIVGAWFVSGFYLVDTTQRAVLSRLGDTIAVVDPGWHWHWPYPLDTVRMINVVSDRTLETGLPVQQSARDAQGLMMTADGNLIAVAYALTYQVTDPLAYLSLSDNPADLLLLLGGSTVRDAVAGQSLGNLLNVADTPLGQELQQSASTRLQAAVDSLKMGVQIKSLVIRQVQLPAPVLHTAKDMERSEQARIQSVRVEQQAALDRLIKARKLAAQLQVESTDYAQTLSAEADALTNRSAPKADASAVSVAQQDIAAFAKHLRQQYPLVFASLSSSQATLQSNTAKADASAVATTKTDDSAGAVSVTAPAVVDGWRNRDIMRSRDRVMRPGDGS